MLHQIKLMYNIFHGSLQVCTVIPHRGQSIQGRDSVWMESTVNERTVLCMSRIVSELGFVHYCEYSFFSLEFCCVVVADIAREDSTSRI